MGATIEKNFSEMSVAEVALAFPQAPDVLNKYGIDYCCGGNSSFGTACEKAGVNASKVYAEISAHGAGAHAHLRDVSNWKPALLIDYIVQVHHTYVKDAIPKLTALLDKTCRAHGAEHPDLMEIRDNFNTLAQELLEHLEKEENILFPEIRETGLDQHTPLQIVLDDVDEEHRTAGKLIKSIRQLADNYTVPEDACTTYTLTYKKLEEFERDLMQHIHLENNVLLKKVSPAID